MANCKKLKMPILCDEPRSVFVDPLSEGAPKGRGTTAHNEKPREKCVTALTVQESGDAAKPELANKRCRTVRPLKTFMLCSMLPPKTSP